MRGYPKTLKPLAFGLLAATFLLAPLAPAAARDRAAVTLELSAQLNVPGQNQPQQQQPKKKAVPQAAPRQAPRQAAPRQGPPPQVRQGPSPQPRQVQPRQVQPRQVQPRQVQPRQPAPPRVGAPPPARTTPRVVTPGTTPAPRGVAPTQRNRNVGAPRAPGATPRVATPRSITPRGPRARTVTTTRLRSAPARGAGRASIRGRNYSVWRGGHRVRRGNSWRTFVALGALSAIVIGGSQYYPYAYLSAPEPYCDGLTADGCQLVWDEVETEEGDIIPQCVAYCPWR